MSAVVFNVSTILRGQVYCKSQENITKDICRELLREAAPMWEQRNKFRVPTNSPLLVSGILMQFVFILLGVSFYFKPSTARRSVKLFYVKLVCRAK